MKYRNILASLILFLDSNNEQEHEENSVPYNLLTTEIEFEVTFKRQLQAPTNRSFGYCDNLRLSIYNNSYL